MIEPTKCKNLAQRSCRRGSTSSTNKVGVKALTQQVNEHPHPAADVTVGRVDKIKRVIRGLPIFQHRHQLAFVHVVADGDDKGLYQAEACEAGCHVRVTLIDTNRASHLGLELSPAPTKAHWHCTPRPSRKIAGHDVASLKVFRMLRCSVPRKIRRRRASHPGYRPQLARHQNGVAERATSNDEVNVVGDQVGMPVAYT